MTAFFDSIINGDYSVILGDLYVPAFAVTAVSCCILGFATVCSSFLAVIKGVFSIGDKQ